MADNDSGGFGFAYSSKLMNNLAQRLEQVARVEPQYKSPVVTLTPVAPSGEAVGEPIPVTVGAPPAPVETTEVTTAHRPVFRQQPAHTSDVQKAYRFGVETTAARFRGELAAAQNEVERYENAIREAAIAAAEIVPEIPKEDQERIAQLRNLINVLDSSAVAPRQVFGATCDAPRQHALLCFREAQKNTKGTPDTLPCANVLNEFVKCAEKNQSMLRLPIPKKPEASENRSDKN